MAGSGGRWLRLQVASKCGAVCTANGQAEELIRQKGQEAQPESIRLDQ